MVGVYTSASSAVLTSCIRSNHELCVRKSSCGGGVVVMGMVLVIVIVIIIVVIIDVGYSGGDCHDDMVGDCTV